jgi:hypothetical protein
MTRWLVALVASFAIAACDEPTPVPQDPRAIELVVAGSLQLGQIGDTSQLTATAVYTGGATRDVTSVTEWSTNAAEVATMSAGGLLTARGLGLVTVTAFHYPVRKSMQGIVTPPGTFILAGRVREPGAGSLAGVTVRHIASGESMVTAGNGRYNLAGVSGSPRLLLTKPDYEVVELQAYPNLVLEPPLQRVIRMAPSTFRDDILAPNDMEYVVADSGASCQPCKLVRVTSPVGGTLRVRAGWSGTNVPLNLWTNGQLFPGNGNTHEVVADIAVVAGETIVYIGRFPGATPLLQQHLSFTIATGAVTPDS